MSALPYIPLLARFSHEDKAAKGLRKLSADKIAPEPPVWFSALEVAAMFSPLLVTAPRGGGKTAFAADLVARPPARLVPRDERGTVLEESWDMGELTPVLLDAAAPDLLAAARATGARGPALLIVDAADRLGAAGPETLAALLDIVEARPATRLVVLCETAAAEGWRLPVAYARHALMPLLVSQRARFAAEAGRALTPAAAGAAAALPGLFALALDVAEPAETAAALVDAAIAAGRVPALAGPDVLARLERGDTTVPVFLLEHLAARNLAGRPPAEAADLFHAAPLRWAGAIGHLAARLTAAGADTGALVDGLIAGAGDSGLKGALAAAGLVAEDPARRATVTAALVRLVEDGRLSAAERNRAGRILADGGDPRDLDRLVAVPGGTFIMGGGTHPNSAPPHSVTVQPFRIGAYPVTNGLYRRFVEATGRPWRSVDGLLPERANAPAVDLTWRDARACCDWLTAHWHAQGRIGADEIVRLPTEPEWERAARGDQPDAGAAIVYPWGLGWDADAANSDEAGFNDTCSVGLFPRGRSPYGAYDMAGQIWEWTTTLWGEDMATPSFLYPYADDGRENPDAGPAIRRVLRGGCFSSGSQKANCTYRGSLEPDGFWRGNGFRVVVAKL